MTTAEKVEGIDAEISRLQGQICVLRSTRNTLQPISHIPADIFFKIFSLFVSNGEKEEHTVRLLHLTWVSNSWRRIALECKALWTCIDRSNHKWAATWIERSGDALLSVDLDRDSFRFGSHKMLDSVSHRLKSLEMKVPRRPRDSLSSWNTSAPCLESLHVQGARIPETSWENRAPALQNLSLYSCTFDFGKVLTTFSRITSLKVTYPHDAFPTQSILQVLEGMPHLEKLILHKVFEEEETVLIPTPNRQSQNSNLVYLEIEHYRPETTLFFIESFSLITEKTSVRVNLCFSNSTSPSLESRFAAINRLHSTHPRALTLLKVGQSGGYSPTLTLAFTSPPHSSPPVAPIRYVLAPAYIWFGELVSAAKKALDLTQLHTLRVHLNDLNTHDAMQLVSLFGPSPEVRRLDLRCPFGAASNFLASVATRLAGPTHDAELVPFPALETYGFVDDQKLNFILSCFLSFRKARGCGLRTLLLGKKETWPQNLVDQFLEEVDEVSFEDSEQFLEFSDLQDEEDRNVFKSLEDDSDDEYSEGSEEE